MAQYKVAVIRGDGIGVEVIEEGIKVLEALSEQFDISWQFEEHPWSSEYYIKNGQMMPTAWIFLRKRTSSTWARSVMSTFKTM